VKIFNSTGYAVGRERFESRTGCTEQEKNVSSVLVPERKLAAYTGDMAYILGHLGRIPDAVVRM
jgi:hypothetical protein